MYKSIINKLPYSKPFLFVDELLHVDSNGVEGTFTFSPNLSFYKGHFKNDPVTPGVILIEVMAQIGVVCLGIHLLGKDFNAESRIALTSSEVEYLKPVFPNEKVRVVSEKIYFRFGKLKCRVKMLNVNNDEVCRGSIAGMIV
ncbi:3-hydroxyacyl-ACP dehydratase FabZ family protein [Flavobacterium wongokense]|uniref:3-hydroxyacyl-ACP dehydratase FabZ family protein n=1 Tax=Flavobacterium wongokense TaxID=2910674 RepID=UPI001F2EF67C|nr:FabA/FabZ family ACP-dehydratase [Flavobacterium sp. WG47]MCF6133412.1 hydroxymyristoyl-ACP dehydratase [Flavobacterium sp. WG47]